MAAQHGRRTTTGATRLILIVGANALCAFLLWSLWSEHRAGAVDARVALSAPAPGAASAAVPRVVRNERDHGLEARVEGRIQSALNRAVSETKGKLDPREVTIAVHVRELAVPGEIVARQADRSLRPASNLKLVTTAAALAVLGPDWCFETRFESNAPIVDGHLRGDLVVRAGGDPLYDPAGSGEVSQLLAPALDELSRAGVQAIDGALVIDEGNFQAPERGPAWPTEKDAWKEYCALAGGFSANAGCLTALVRASDGGAARVDVRPNGHGRPEKLAVRTVGARQSLDVRVGALHDPVVVEGSIPSDVPEWSARFAVPDPVDLFARCLLASLRARGIDPAGGLARERRPVSGLRTLALLRTPLASVLEPINTHSNNACADQLFLALGHAAGGRGTRTGGRAAVASALDQLGIDASSLVQVDGSGLSREDRISARQITALLDAVLRRDARTAKLFLDSLAVGSESGTLDERMKDPLLAGRVHAKTGFINGTSALSGILDAHDGRTLIFSILVEYPNFGGLNQSCWKPMEDALCSLIAQSQAQAKSDG